MASTTATTECTITNAAGQNLVLALSNYETAAGTINNTGTATFTQTMPAIYLNGALVYEVGRSLKWINFWTTDNQVSTKMFQINDPIDWGQVANNLRHGGSEDRITDTDGTEYSAWATIESNSIGQVLTANILASPVPN
ncbi:hypothetical protein Goshw_016780 [Gossypium schwendimanii]|uniref:Uncharacterized protein n=1 Tax=Gossypium schwendimanii TaxID=34291 RepID=A0A7J9M4D6_GOSSC|nr:hypothetical protein [Gossypium schwendimanii]